MEETFWMPSFGHDLFLDSPFELGLTAMDDAIYNGRDISANGFDTISLAKTKH